MKKTFCPYDIGDFEALIRRLDKDSKGTVTIHDLFQFVFPYSSQSKAFNDRSILDEEKPKHSEAFSQIIKIPSGLQTRNRTFYSSEKPYLVNSHQSSLQNFYKSQPTHHSPRKHLNIGNNSSIKAREQVMYMHQNYYTRQEEDIHESEHPDPHHQRFYYKPQHQLYSSVKADKETNLGSTKRYDTPFRSPLKFTSSDRYYSRYYSNLFKSNLSEHFTLKSNARF